MRFKLSRRATPTPHRNMELDTNHSECYCHDQNLVSPQPRVLLTFPQLVAQGRKAMDH